MINMSKDVCGMMSVNGVDTLTNPRYLALAGGAMLLGRPSHAVSIELTRLFCYIFDLLDIFSIF